MNCAFMRYFFLEILLLLAFQTYSRNQDSARLDKKIFIRLYGREHNKIGKGDLLYGNDSIIRIARGHKEISFPVYEISFIKTRRSAGHTILVGAAIGTGVGIILGAASNNSNSDETSAASFDLAFAAGMAPFVGTICGGIAAGLRKKETIQINGDIEKWKEAKQTLLHLNQGQKK